MGFPLDADQVWCQVLNRSAGGGPALFLDRDGVVIEEKNYLSRPEDIAIIPGAAKAISAANTANTAVILITNQAGIGRGYYTWAEFSAVQQALVEKLAQDGARIDAVYACAHHAEGKGEFAHPNHPARKPNPGMLLRARDALSLDLAKSWMVGDRVIDLQAAKSAGAAGAMHVLTGYGRDERPGVSAIASPTFKVRLGNSIANAVGLVTAN
ncbi:MAG: HAD family hydrolase [Pseudolabrys sp.]|nr:HAD family hydrolase [Pseudolabrys sp.]